MNLERGQRYRVVMQVPGVWNVPREAVMQYLWREGDRLFFSLRPEAGTSDIEIKHIVAIEPTTAAVHVPRKVKR
jgi:hypothetical protein